MPRSKKARARTRVSFQGEHGAFSERAIFSMLGHEVETVPCPDLHAAFQAVEDNRVECAVVPIENSTGGSIDDTYEELMRRPVFIEAETQIPISQCLLTARGATLETVTHVYSHPQGLAQCKQFLRRHDAWQLHAVYDTAGAARMVSEGEAGMAAIAPEGAADIYGLQVLRADIQDDPGNKTRFIRVGREITPATGSDKTSLMFILKDVPGALFKAIAAFSLREINLRKLQSRPSRARPWHYTFYVDCEGHQDDATVQKALAHLQELTTFLKVLGSYPDEV